MSRPAQRIRDHVLSQVPGATLHSRHRHGLKFRHPADPNRYIYMAYSGTPVHILGTETEVDTAWQPSSVQPWQLEMTLADYHAYFGNGNLAFSSGMPFRYQDPNTGEYFQWQPSPNIQWVNDLQQVENIGLAKQAVDAVVNDDTLDFVGAYGPGIDYRVRLNPGHFAKFLILQNDIPPPPQFIIDGGNPAVMYSVQFQRSAGVSIWVDGVEWGEGNGQQNAVQTFGKVEFRSAGGESLFYLVRPSVKESAFRDIDPPQVATRIRRQGNSYFVEVRVPWSWLSGATFPVYIDPTTNPTVAASSDDAHEKYNNGSMTLDGSTVQMRSWNIASQVYWAAWRWQLSASGTVNTSYLQIRFDSTASDDPDVDLDFEAADSAGTMTTTSYDISGRTLTGNAVSWVDTSLGYADYSNSPSLNTPLQAIFDRGGWSSGNYVVLVGVPDAALGSPAYADHEAYDASGSYPPAIYVDYTAASGTTLTVADGAHSHAVDSPALTQHHTLAVNDGQHSNAVDSPSLTQHFTLTGVADGLHDHAADSPSLTQHHTLAVNDGLHDHAADSPALTQAHTLAVNDGLHAHAAESPALIQHHVLAVNDGLHAHAADSPSLAPTVTLTAQDGQHAHAADAPTLVQHHVLVVQDGLHSNTLDAVALTQAHVLAVNDGLHSNTLDAVDLSGAVTLTVQDGAHSHTSETPALIQHYTLAVNDGLHDHTADGPALPQHHVLVVQDGAHSHTSETVALIQHHVLTVADGLHAQVTDGIVLVQAQILTGVADGLHAHYADGVTWPGAARRDNPANIHLFPIVGGERGL